MVSWTTPTVTGVYTVLVSGFITNAIGVSISSTTFVLTVIDMILCVNSADSIIITPSTTTPVSMKLTNATSGT